MHQANLVNEMSAQKNGRMPKLVREVIIDI
jgi:hypothetical protein